MSTIGKVGSAVKRAALYIPRKVATAYRNARMGLKPGFISMMKSSLRSEEIVSPQHLVHVEDQAHGPFRSTNVGEGMGQRGRWAALDQKFFFRQKYKSKIREIDRINAKIRSVFPNAYITIRDGEHVDLSAADIAKGIQVIEDEAVGPFVSTAVKSRTKKTEWLNIAFWYLDNPMYWIMNLIGKIRKK